jgi:hypothetical protein
VLARITGFLTGVVLSCAVIGGAASPALAVSAPDLTASVSNSVSGTTTLGHSWTWTIHVGNAPATSVALFNSGQTVISDDVDASTHLAFGTPTMANASGVTGTVNCSILSHTLSCTANGTVQIQPGGGFDVTVTVDPVTAGIFSNPRLFGNCQVDPFHVVAESDDTNNDCTSDSVAVRAPDLTVAQSDDVVSQVFQGGAWHWVLTVANTGSADATFAPGTTIVQDDLSSSPGLSYGQPTVQNVTGVTNWGNITCSINSAKTLTCTASGSPVTVSSGAGTFDVSILVTPSQTGEYTSPRASGICRVDPNNAIAESDETNNDVSQPDVVDVYKSVDLGVTDVGSPDPNVVAGSLGGVDNLTHTITLTNHGPDPTTGATVNIDFGAGLPTGVHLDTSSASAGSYDPQSGIWTVGSLANNAQATLTLTFSVPTGAPDNSNVITDANVAPTEDFAIDPDSSDDQASVVTGVQASGVVQTVGVTPSSKDFGSQRVGTTSTAQTFTITNHDTATLNIATATLVGTNPDQFFEASDTCSGHAIPSAQSCTVAVAFAPTTTGAQTANLEINSNAPSSPTEIVLHGSGTESVISASSSSASFGNQNVNSTSASQSFQITNNGTATLHITLATLAGNDANQYVEPTDGCSHTALNAGQSCTVSVAFRPTSTGPQNDATLDISSDDPGGTFHVALSGSGVAPTASPTPNTKRFGSQAINTTSAAQTFQIKNTGNAALTISRIGLAGADAAQYTTSNDTCPTQLATSAVCTIDVAFAPTTAGAHDNATLDIASDDPSGTFHITLSGTGLATTVSVTPPSNNFGNQRVGTTGPTQTFTIKNTGTNTLTIASVHLGGSDAAQFTASNNTCTAPLAANATCGIDVAFAPTTYGSHNAATLDITSDGAPAVDHIALSGIGILGAISPSMNSHDFGSQRVGTTSAAQRLTVTNSGTDTLSISSAVLAGTDAAQYTTANDGCTNKQLLAGSKCTIDVAFKPTSTGSHPDARIDITSDAATSVVHITFTGTGTLPTVTPSLSAHDFGTQRVGTTSATQTFVIHNTGFGALNVSSVSLVGSNADQYTVLADRCSAQIVAAGQACTVDVTFTPSTTGAHSATILIHSDAPSSPDQLSLNGTGAQPALSLSPNRQDFGTVTIGTSSSPATFTISNTGGAAMTITGTTVTGADAAQYPRSADHCSGQSLAPGATCTVQVAFHPTATGVHNRASLQVSSDAGTVSAALTGRAAAPSNTFTIGHLKIRGNGTAQFDITVHAAGTVSAVTSAPKVSVFGKVRVRAGRAGTVHITVMPSSAGLKLVKHHHGALRIQLSIGFTPTFGSARTQTFHGLFVAK